MGKNQLWECEGAKGLAGASLLDCNSEREEEEH